MFSQILKNLEFHVRFKETGIHEEEFLQMLCMVNSFIQRRVKIDVGPTDLVLDIGSGDKPHWRADVLLDKHPSESFAISAPRGGSCNW